MPGPFHFSTDLCRCLCVEPADLCEEHQYDTYPHEELRCLKQLKYPTELSSVKTLLPPQVFSERWRLKPKGNFQLEKSDSQFWLMTNTCRNTWCKDYQQNIRAESHNLKNFNSHKMEIRTLFWRHSHCQLFTCLSKKAFAKLLNITFGDPDAAYRLMTSITSGFKISFLEEELHR